MCEHSSLLRPPFISRLRKNFSQLFLLLGLAPSNVAQHGQADAKIFHNSFAGYLIYNLLEECSLNQKENRKLQEVKKHNTNFAKTLGFVPRW